MQNINYWALPSPAEEGAPIRLQDGINSITVRLKGAAFQLDEELQALYAYAAAAGVPLEDGSSLGRYFPLLGALTTAQLPRIHLPPASEELEVGLQEDSRDLALPSSTPHEVEVQPDLATVVQKYAHLFKEYPLLFRPQDESPPPQQAVVTLALTEAKRSATTEKGDRWCHTPDPLNLIREAGLRGRIPMGVDCKASIPKAGLYLLVPRNSSPQRFPQWTNTLNQSVTNAPRGCTEFSDWLFLESFR
jgi:hypothetical protein